MKIERIEFDRVRIDTGYKDVYVVFYGSAYASDYEPPGIATNNPSVGWRVKREDNHNGVFQWFEDPFSTAIEAVDSVVQHITDREAELSDAINAIDWNTPRLRTG